jgi:hypothetical protein
MPKTVEVELGETKYQVPRLNIDQLERVTDLFQSGQAKTGFGVLRIACERAEPKIAKFEDLDPTTDQIAAAVGAVLVLSGMKKAEGASAGEEKPAAAS